MLPLNFRHGQQIIQKIHMTCRQRIPGRVLILPDVLAFQESRSIHGSKPTCDLTQAAQGFSDPSHCLFLVNGRSLSQNGKDFSYPLPVADLLHLNPADHLLFLWIAHRMAVPDIGIDRPQLPGIGIF